MWTDNDIIVFSVALAVQFAGLVSVAIARFGQQSTSKIKYERFFCACLALVAVISFLAICAGEGSCVMHGVTLAMMAVGATIDTRASQKADPIF